VLIVGAMPSEIGVVLRATTVQQKVTVDGRRFYVGKLAGNNVVLAMSGIGLVNAEQTATAAFKQFRCGTANGISATVFTGVSGGPKLIGDVMVPAKWRRSGNPDASWVQVNPTMMAVARQAAATVKLESRAPVGDVACACVYQPDRIKPVNLKREPRVYFDGAGASADPFGGEKFFCVPNGGNVFGCEPCRDQAHSPKALPPFINDFRPYIGPSFFTNYFKPTTPDETPYVAGDMETAAVAEVAKKNNTPFIGFRALSDGKGDPLLLSKLPSVVVPAWVIQFAYYQQIAADNAGRLTIAFLKGWAQH
jgi:nucleoside phosphorylase